MSDKRLRALEEEIAYLRKGIDELKKMRIMEIHTHYYYDYDNIKTILDKYIDDNNLY